jgi:hypothetical protein
VFSSDEGGSNAALHRSQDDRHRRSIFNLKGPNTIGGN